MFHAGLDERADMEFKQRQKPVAVSFDAVLIIATICHGHPFIPKLAAAKASKYFLWLILGFFFCLSLAEKKPWPPDHLPG